MIKNKTSIRISIIVCSFIAVVLLGLLLFGPQAFELYMEKYRGFTPNGQALNRLMTVFGACFYPCAVIAFVILYFLLKLLFNIKNENVFIGNNIICLKIISYCLFLIGIITFVGGFFYMPFIFVSAAGLFTGMLLRVLKNVFGSAVELQTENDLTI